MTLILSLLLIQGLFGAFDTLYYHEWRARLPGLGAQAGAELKLHALRDFIYAIVFATLPWIGWHGLWAGVFVILLVAEIIITLADFVVEDRVRKPLGGVFPGERITHALMGIIYGAMLAYLIPVIIQWWQLETDLVMIPYSIPLVLRWFPTLMAAGLVLSGVRDLCAAYELPHSAWPWRR
jgi:hypothetical protein